VAVALVAVGLAWCGTLLFKRTRARRCDQKEQILLVVGQDGRLKEYFHDAYQVT